MRKLSQFAPIEGLSVQRGMIFTAKSSNAIIFFHFNG